MILLEILKALFNPETPPPAAPPAPTQKARVAPATEAVRLTIQKLVAQLRLIERAYGLNFWTDPDHQRKWAHDLGLRHQHGDLQGVTLELVDKQDRAYQFAFELTGAGQTKGFDLAGGLELPVLKGAEFNSHRLLVYRRGGRREDLYREALLLPWSESAARPRQAGTEIASEHTADISGGRMALKMHLGGQSVRHLVVVTQTGAKGFGFGVVPDLAGAKIYLNTRFAPPGLAFGVGARLSVAVVQTPRGLQARDIRQETA